jgi:hypothetical protein
MSNLSTKRAPKKAATSPVTSTGEKTLTYEGGIAYTRDTKSALFTMGTTNFYGENTFYEAADERAKRFRGLVRTVTAEDPKWVADFLKWLRTEANIRTAAIVGAVEYCQVKGAPARRQVINSVIVRADEPAEALAYSKIMEYPNAGGFQRGIADAAARLYHERNALKYDGQSRAMRMGDVIALARVKPRDEKQADLFKYLITKRHNRDDLVIPESLGMIDARQIMESIPVDQRRALLNHQSFSGALEGSGGNWEWLSGWLSDGKGMDKAAWEAMIPSMGYMALLRNLRNFDEAGVSDKVAAEIAARLADRDEVLKSRQLPFRFLSAYLTAPSLRWSWALEQALNHSTENIPALPGRTLILVDISGSMTTTLGDRSQVQLWKVGALFAAALTHRSQMSGGTVEVVGFGTNSLPFPVPPHESVLKTLKRFDDWQDASPVGHGTNTGPAITKNFTGQDRVIVFTDMQSFSMGGYFGSMDISSTIPPKTPLYAFNLAGYAQGDLDTRKAYRHEFSGFTDNAFKMIPLIEQSQSQSWPWETK